MEIVIVIVFLIIIIQLSATNNYLYNSNSKLKQVLDKLEDVREEISWTMRE